MNYKDWLFDWLENYVKSSSKTNTYEIYRMLSVRHVIPYLGDKNLSDLTVADLQKLISHLLANGNTRTGKGLSTGSVNLVISVIQSSLKTAYFVGLVPQYFANRIKHPKCDGKQVQCFSVAEQNLIEEYVLSSSKERLFGIVLCLYTGLRIGELLALTWDDIDFSQGLLRVSKTCHDRGGSVFEHNVGSPKTLYSKRVIPVPDRLLLYLQNMYSRSDCNFVISNGGRPVFIRSYQRTFALLQRKLGIEHKGFHSLRHTFATRALECGMDVKTLAELLGHKSATVTLNRYAHSLFEHKVVMMNRLGEKLRDFPQELVRLKK